MDRRGEIRATRQTAAKRLSEGEIDRETARRIAGLLEDGKLREAQERLFASTRNSE